MSWFKRAVDDMSVTVVPKAEIPKPAPPVLPDWSDDQERDYRYAKAAERAAKWPIYYKNRPCSKCGSKCVTNEHRTEYHNIEPSGTLKERRRLAEEYGQELFDWEIRHAPSLIGAWRRASINQVYSWEDGLYGFACQPKDRGPSYIARTCQNCSYSWNERAIDAAPVQGSEEGRP